MAKSQINFGELGGGASATIGSIQIPSGSSYTEITLGFEPSSILMYTVDGGYHYFGAYSKDLDSTHCWKNQGGSNENAFLPVPSTGRQGFYCEIKEITSTGFVVWNYSGYTLNYVAYP